MAWRSLYWGVRPHWLAVLTIRRTLPLYLARSTSLASMSLTRKSRTDVGFLGESWAETIAAQDRTSRAARAAKPGRRSDRSDTVVVPCAWGSGGGKISSMP